MAIRNLYHRPVLIMTEIDLSGGPMLLWLMPGAGFRGGHDGVALPGMGLVWKCLGRKFGPLFIGFPTLVEAGGRASGLWTFALKDAAGFCARHPEWAPLHAVALNRGAGPGAQGWPYASWDEPA